MGRNEAVVYSYTANYSDLSWCSTTIQRLALWARLARFYGDLLVRKNSSTSGTGMLALSIDRSFTHQAQQHIRHGHDRHQGTVDYYCRCTKCASIDQCK